MSKLTKTLEMRNILLGKFCEELCRYPYVEAMQKAMSFFNAEELEEIFPTITSQHKLAPEVLMRRPGSPERREITELLIAKSLAHRPFDWALSTVAAWYPTKQLRAIVKRLKAENEETQ